MIVPVYAGAAELPFKGKIVNLNAASKHKYWDVAAWRKLAQLIKREQPHVIQANAGDTLKYAVFSKLLFRWKQPIIFRNASTISLYIKTPLVKKLYRFLFSKTDKIISVSKASAADFKILYPEFQHKITVMPIGIEQDSGIEDKMLHFPFVDEDVSNDSPMLVHVGGFTFEKNHVGLIRIFENVLQKSPGARLYLIGDGPMRKEIEHLVNTKGLYDKVIFKGFQKEPLQWIQKADVLLLPSHIEGLPGVILEAFYCKTPVVAYDTGGIKEVVIPNQTGWLISKDDEAAFADAVLLALEKHEHNNKMIETAFKLVKSQYMNAEVAKGFLNIYKAALS